MGAFFTKIGASIAVGVYLGAIVGVGDIALLIIVEIGRILFTQGILAAIGVTIGLGILLYFGGIILVTLAAIAGGVVGGILGFATGLASGVICGSICALVEEDQIQDRSSPVSILMGVISALVFSSLCYYANGSLWFTWQGYDWMGWVNVIAFLIIGYLVGTANSETLDKWNDSDKEKTDADGEVDLLAPFRLFGKATMFMYDTGEKTVGTVKSATKHK